ncbi:Elmo domain-containing protein b, partial [Globisporangium splendens]
MDLDEAMRGIFLLGGSEGESEKCAVILSSKLKYVPIDARSILLRFEEAERQRRLQQALELVRVTEGGSGDPLAGVTISMANPDIGDTEKPLQIDSYQLEVKQYIEEEMKARGARGFVLFNWEFTTYDANQLIGMGFPVDSIIDLQTPAPLPPQKPPASGASTTASSPTTKQPASLSRTRATPNSSPVKPSTTNSRVPSAASRNATPATSGSAAATKSPSKSTPISSSSSPSRASSRQAPPKTPEPKKRPVETPSKQSQQKAPPTPTGKRPTATPAATPKSAVPSPEKKPPKIDRKAQFKGMMHRSKKKKAAPFVQWDEATQRTNEMLAMFAEDVHMMIHVEQENRKPKKPGDLSPPSSSSIGSGAIAGQADANRSWIGGSSRGDESSSDFDSDDAYDWRLISNARVPKASRAAVPRQKQTRVLRDVVSPGKLKKSIRKRESSGRAKDEGMERTTPAHTPQRKRRDTPAVLQTPQRSTEYAAGDDELEEKTGVVHLSELVEIPMEDDESHDDMDAHHNEERKSWAASGPTMMQLPSRKHSGKNSGEDDGSSLRPLDPPPAPVRTTADDEINSEVFNELPVDIQQEILAERAARMAVNIELVDNGGEWREGSSRDASFESNEECATDLRLGDGWVCRVCTYVNHPQLIECEICETLCIQPDDYTGDFEDEAEEVRAARRLSTPTSSSSNRSRSSSSELYSKLSQKISSTAMSKTLQRIRLPATPAATKLTMKEDPTAEDLLIVATAKIQQLQSTASQGFLHAKNTIIAKTSSSSRKNSMHGEPSLPSLEAASELGVLQRDLNMKCESDNEIYESLLERLWNAIYQDAPAMRKAPSSGEGSLSKRPFERISDGWIDIGFQGTNPDTDFRGGGLLALKCLVYAFEAFPQRMFEIVLSQKPSGGGKKWYPVCVAGINLTCMIAGCLKLGNGKYTETPETFWKLFEEPSAFYQLFFYVVLKAMRKMVVYILDQAPESLDDLREAADRTFLDRFIVCMSSSFLEDSENGECPDPYNVLEDDNEVLLTPSRSSLSAKLTAASPTR